MVQPAPVIPPYPVDGGLSPSTPSVPTESIDDDAVLAVSDSLNVAAAEAPDLSEGNLPSFGMPEPAPASASPQPNPASPPITGNTPNLPNPASAAGSGPASSVEELLVRDGIITQEQLQQIRAEAINTGKENEQILFEKKLVNEEQLARAKAKFYNIEYVVIAEIGVAPEALNLVPEGVAQRYSMLPFGVDKRKNVLSVAMANPLDLRAIDFVEKKTGFRLIPYMSTRTEVEASINERYSQSLSSEVTKALKDTSHDKKKVVDVKNLGEVIREAPIAKIVETVLTFAIKARASDVHIEPQEEKTRIRYRIDGILHEKLVLPKGVQDAVVSRIKILADLKIDEKRLPQDGRFTFRSGDQEIDLRVSSLPTVNGEKIVMRLLKKSTGAVSLPELGLRGAALKNVEQAILVPHGIILITGPTGSGKTTTLYSILSRINTPKVNIMTLEDPVEYEIPGVNQVQINSKAGLTFASGLRSFLRQDPNIIMVGEIRDQETAELAIQASLTGHLVFSTLHTNSAAGALPRLMDMKAEPFLLASSMTLVMAQRVVRQICPHCKTTYKPETAVVQDMAKILGPMFNGFLKQHQVDIHNFVLYKGAGCSECNDTGYTGRVGVFEVLPISEKVGRLILEQRPAVDIETQAISDGMLLMKQDGYMKAMEGLTTLEEVLRVAEV